MMPFRIFLASRWRKWRKGILELETLAIFRCVKPSDFGKVFQVQLHHFSDACEVGLGQCSYLRMINDEERIHCSFIMGKSRVSPLKQITIPRLELTATVISAKMSKFLKNELQYDFVEEYFWVDSQIVLDYVNNEAKRFNVYVANRVQQIRDLSAKMRRYQWR